MTRCNILEVTDNEEKDQGARNQTAYLVRNLEVCSHFGSHGKFFFVHLILIGAKLLQFVDVVDLTSSISHISKSTFEIRLLI